jgi:hypothetical protein
MRTAWHALVGVALSGQRRFVPRASTAVNYKFAPLGARNGATIRTNRQNVHNCSFCLLCLKKRRGRASHAGAKKLLPLQLTPQFSVLSSPFSVLSSLFSLQGEQGGEVVAEAGGGVVEGYGAAKLCRD